MMFAFREREREKDIGEKRCAVGRSSNGERKVREGGKNDEKEK